MTGNRIRVIWCDVLVPTCGRHTVLPQQRVDLHQGGEARLVQLENIGTLTENAISTLLLLQSVNLTTFGRNNNTTIKVIGLTLGSSAGSYTMTDLGFVSWKLHNDRPGVCQLCVTQCQTLGLSAGCCTMSDLVVVSWVLHNVRSCCCQLVVTKCQTWGLSAGCYTMSDLGMVS